MIDLGFDNQECSVCCYSQQGEAQLDSARRKLQKKYDLLSNGLQLLKQIGTWAETGEEGGGVVPQPPSTQCDQVCSLFVL